MEANNVNTTSQNEDTITFIGLKIKKSDGAFCVVCTRE